MSKIIVVWIVLILFLCLVQLVKFELLSNLVRAVQILQTRFIATHLNL